MIVYKNLVVIFETIKKSVHGRKQKVGLIMGINDDGVIKIGWSKTNLKLGDKFNADVGRELAMNRILGIEKFPTLPLCMGTRIRNFEGRCLRYFKDAGSMAFNHRG